MGLVQFAWSLLFQNYLLKPVDMSSLECIDNMFPSGLKKNIVTDTWNLEVLGMFRSGFIGIYWLAGENYILNIGLESIGQPSCVFKKRYWGCRGDSVVKESTSYSFRGSSIRSSHPHGGSKPSYSCSRGSRAPSETSPCTHVIYIHGGKTLTWSQSREKKLRWVPGAGEMGT